MPAAEAKQLLRAIEDFTEAYQGDEMYASVLESLNGVASEVQQITGDTEEPSPGRQAAREASEEKREKPPALREANPPEDEGEEPRNFGEAAERARGRFPRRAKTSSAARREKEGSQ